jgi:uncharacterized membrane protein
MDERELRRIIDRLTARIARLEREVGIDRAAPDEPRPDRQSPAATPTPPPVPSETPPAAPPAAPPIVPGAVAPPPPVPAGPESLAEKLGRKREELVPQAPSVTAPMAPPATRPKRSLEILIGRFWLAIVAAFVIVLGVGFFVKYAYDQGWIANLPPAIRCMFAAAFGGVLIGVGEVVLRRIGRAGALGLFGAGLATLYLTVYGTFNLDLVSEVGGLFLLGLVALVGFGLTWRSRSLSIGVLSILGGYLTPIFLGDATAFTNAFPLFITMLLGVSLGLSAIRAEPFRPLRYVALGGHALLGLIWLGAARTGSWELMLAFMTIWWGMVAAEAILAALREESPVGNAAASLFSTACFVTAGCWVLSSLVPAGAGEMWLGLFTLGVGGVAAAAAAQFGPGLEGLRGVPRSAMDKLALALWAQAGVLLAVAIALQFDDFGRSIGWLAVGLASVEIGRRLPSRGVSVFGLLIGALALLRIALLDWHLPALSRVWFSVGDEIEVTYWAILALIAVVATQIAARRLYGRNEASASVWRTLLCVIGMLGWMGVCAVAADGLITTGGWLIGAAMLLGFDRLGRRQHYAEIGGLVLLMAAGKWLMHDVLSARVGAAWDPAAHLPLANLQMVIALAVVVVGWWTVRVFSRRALAAGADPGGTPRWSIVPRWQPAVNGLIGFLVVALSFELDRGLGVFELRLAQPAYSPLYLRALWLTLLWGGAGLVAAIVGRAVPWRRVTLFGALLTCAAALVWLSADTLGMRVDRGVLDVPVVLNLQFGVGAALAVALAFLARVTLSADEATQESTREEMVLLRGMAVALIAAIGLWLVSFEIDRFFDVGSMAKQTALSVWWALYGVGLVSIGFVRRLPMSRYVGLGLFAVTLGKVLVYDLSGLDEIWRILSLIIVGLLVLATSVGYAKVAPRLLREGEAEDDLAGRAGSPGPT